MYRPIISVAVNFVLAAPLAVQTWAGPEPGALALFSLAAGGWVRFWRRRWAAPAAASQT